MTNYRGLPSGTDHDGKLLAPYPMLYYPEIAAKIGDAETLFLGQLHYWLTVHRGKEFLWQIADDQEDHYWYYQTLEDWRTQFPGWSISKIRRVIASLKEKKLIKVGNYNRHAYDRTRWYTIDYNVLDRVRYSNIGTPEGPACGDEVNKFIGSGGPDAFVQNEHIEVPRTSTPIQETDEEIEPEIDDRRVNRANSSNFAPAPISQEISSLAKDEGTSVTAGEPLQVAPEPNNVPPAEPLPDPPDPPDPDELLIDDVLDCLREEGLIAQRQRSNGGDSWITVKLDGDETESIAVKIAESVVPAERWIVSRGERRLDLILTKAAGNQRHRSNSSRTWAAVKP